MWCKMKIACYLQILKSDNNQFIFSIWGEQQLTKFESEIIRDATVRDQNDRDEVNSWESENINLMQVDGAQEQSPAL